MNQAFLRGFIKAAHANGVHPADLIKIVKVSASGWAPALMGALPGAIGGGYLAYDRALERQKKEPTSINPQMAAALGAVGGGGLGALAGTAAGSIGYERGATDSSQYHKALMEQLSDAYMKA